MLRDIAELDWQPKLKMALDDVTVRDFVHSALVEGYERAGVPEPETLVSEIFRVLSTSSVDALEATLERIRTDLNGRWHGRSIRERWSEYYRDTESLHIAQALLPHIAGPRLLEVGVGRGWVSHQLDRLSEASFQITQTDIHDYREECVRENPRFRFVPVGTSDPLPFTRGDFDTIVLVYVLHHCPPDPWRKAFLRKLAGLGASRIVILDDTFLLGAAPDHPFPQAQAGLCFDGLSEQQKVLALHFSCTVSNKVDGGGAAIPAPAVFREFTLLTEELRDAFRPATITARYCGIPWWKVYLNAEGILVVESTSAPKGVRGA